VLVKIVIVVLLAILASLMTSMSFLIRDESSRRRTLTALKLRVALSITLMLFVLLSWHMGWIEPHGLIPKK
jgi:hypothetical protein